MDRRTLHLLSYGTRLARCARLAAQLRATVRLLDQEDPSRLDADVDALEWEIDAVLNRVQRDVLRHEFRRRLRLKDASE